MYPCLLTLCPVLAWPVSSQRFPVIFDTFQSFPFEHRHGRFFSAPKSSGIKSLLDKDSEIPTDISFEIVDGTEIVTLKAHKLILAAHSVFFRKAFFGSGLNFKESSGTVIIKETTKEAFEAMIDFIYEKNENLKYKTVEQLFDLLNISKRYQVDDW